MEPAPAHDLHGRGVPRLLRHFAAVDRLTGEADTQSGRERLEVELGCDLAGLLVWALARRPAPGCVSRA